MKTYPRNWKDYWLWPVLRLIWAPLTGGKISCGWHWINWINRPKLAVTIPLFRLDHKAKERTGWWSSFWLTNFGWRKIVTLQPRYEEDQAFRLGNAYRIGFQAGATVQICTIVLHGNPVAVLLGPGPVSFFAYSYPDNEEILLAICDYSDRKTRSKHSTFI